MFIGLKPDAIDERIATGAKTLSEFQTLKGLMEFWMGKFLKTNVEKNLETHSPDSNGYPTARAGKSLGARSNSG